MPRTGLTPADIATAYDALVDAGLQPSIRAILERLGNTCSLKTVADHVRALKTERWEQNRDSLRSHVGTLEDTATSDRNMIAK